MPEDAPLEKKAKKITKKKTAKKAEAKPARDIGIDVELPSKTCTDMNCPFHGTLSVRGQKIDGTVASSKMDKTIVVKREFMRYVPKYERYEKRSGRYAAHLPPCMEISPGDEVTIMECRPISKSVSFVVVARR